jgi:hypothetical protein
LVTQYEHLTFYKADDDDPWTGILAASFAGRATHHAALQATPTHLDAPQF